MKKLVIFLLLFTFVCSSSIFADCSDDSVKIETAIYLTEDSEANTLDKIGVKKHSMNDSYNMAQASVLLLDDTIFSKTELMQEIKNRYNNGKKTIYLTKTKDKNDIRRIYELKLRDKTKKEKDGVENDKTVSDPITIGFVAYKYGVHDIVASINIVGDSIEEETNQAIIHAINYDYSKLYGPVKKKTSSIASNSLCFTISSLVDTPWEILDSDSGSTTGYDVTVSSSLRFYEDQNNPDANGNNYYYAYCVNDSDSPSSDVGKERISILGHSTSKILEYGPTAQTTSTDSSNVSYEFQATENIAIIYTPGVKLKITKDSGGIDSRNIAMLYQPKNSIGLNKFTTNSYNELA